MQLLIQSNGRILVDGVEIVDGNRKAWHKIIAHVPQNIYLADTSIAQNIAFGEKACSIDIGRLKIAANAAQINQHIESLPLGYDTIVGENGVKMSGGQRQRIGIARALYKNSEIIILDEATSALDSITEESVMESIKLWDKNITILIIAHRHNTLKNCNKVYRLAGGSIQPVSQSELLNHEV
jgi:ATP-binding cassette subfamily B protein